MFIYFSRLKLFRWLLMMVIIIAVLAIFPMPIKNMAQEVVTVLAQGRLVPIYAVDTPEKIIAFSFDATWGSTRTPKILQILDDYELKTTFFLTNIWLKEYPQLAKEISERGHEIGLHTANHPCLTDLGKEKISEELVKNAELITEITAQKPNLFRPPFGAYNNLVINTAADLDFITIQWSVDSLDWQNLSAKAMFERVKQKIHPGAIVLFHNDGENTPEALKLLLPYLQKEGYQIVPISKLIYNENYYIDQQGIQKQKN